MSLRRRITAVVAVAVAVIAVLIGAAGYELTRSQLMSGIRQELVGRASALAQRQRDASNRNPQAVTRFFAQHQPAGGAGGPRGSARVGYGSPGGRFRPPPGPGLGGAAGYFQIVPRSGAPFAAGTNAAALLPVTSRVRAATAGNSKQFFFDATIDRTHVEILVVPDTRLHVAAEIAEPLTEVDSDLSGLLVPYGLIAGGGVLLAVLVGLFVARSAIRPISRFTAETEQVTRSLERPRRLEETGAEEVRRLAAYFNRALEALERSVAAQRHLVADASHELRTPLAALRSNIQIFLEADRLPAAEREELQEAIVAEVDDLTQLVADVMELARGANPSDVVEQVELDGLIRDAVARTQRRAPGLEFELELEPTVLVNSADRVARAVLNVIDNARKWSAPDGLIGVTLKDGLLAVRDHGPGFAPEDLPLVFDRFYRADDSRRMPGSGLGLAIVKQAAEAHGGFARAANAPGGGALVEVSFGPSLPVAHRPPAQLAL